ncbi:hypothetical protein N7510_002644 [Penicillium lagena]|uniref:uncharacterized protein n=1 Tax=Penicillium lagena TaxID=94218 RepID=UPI002540231B|nr:uncharacterized protein N7510_002644 [Penicillium lagena]KAJ5626335.1 hypothetical protein N7510_002644 [Penicillium lagena]
MAPGNVESQVAPATTFTENGEIKTKEPVVSVQPVQEKAVAPYTVTEQPMNTRRPFRTVCMGAGYAGLMLGIIAKEKMQDPANEFVIYEKNSDIGGTWLENRYPGCQCDIPAHNYSYSFEQNPDWPNYYATSSQILAYIKKTCAKYGVEPYMNYNHKIVSAVWDERKTKWLVKVQNGDKVFIDECDMFIYAGGNLNNWKWPDIKGLHDFEGKLLHSAAWDESYDFTGKKTAVIGIGSSGIQIVPKLAPISSHLTTFIRSKTWVSPAPGINEPTSDDPEADERLNFTEATLKRFREDPDYLLKHRRAVSDRRNANFDRAYTASPQQQKAQVLYKKTMKARLGDSEKGKKIYDMLVPDYPVGCRRQTPGQGYLEALCRDNVDVKWDDIGYVTRKGIMTKSGEEIEFDAIVCATGFHTDFKPRFPIVGRKGINLQDQYADIPEAYFGLTTPNFPNFFTFIGPNSPISNGSLILAMQLTAIYIYKAITKIQSESIRTIEISEEATHDFNEHCQEFLKRTVWTSGCRSWYKKGTVDGRIVAIYGGTTYHWMEVVKNPRWEDWKIEYRQSEGGGPRNRFAYLGNGFTKREAAGGTVGESQTLTFEGFWDLFNLPDIFDSERGGARGYKPVMKDLGASPAATS